MIFDLYNLLECRTSSGTRKVDLTAKEELPVPLSRWAGHEDLLGSEQWLAETCSGTSCHEFLRFLMLAENQTCDLPPVSTISVRCIRRVMIYEQGLCWQKTCDEGICSREKKNRAYEQEVRLVAGSACV